jgi:acetyltransferase-like isoleucine patch superfamily enzyme
MKHLRWVGYDLAFYLLLSVVTGVPLALLGWGIPRISLPMWLGLALTPTWVLLFLVGCIGMVGLVRSLLPRLEPGSYPFPEHSQTTVWLLHFALQRIVNLPLWSSLINAFATLRWLALTALGAKVAFNMRSSVDVSIVDHSLVELGPECMLGAGTQVSGHFIEDDQLILAPVSIGAGAQIMGDAGLAPGVVIGPNAVIGPGSKLLPRVRVGEEAFIGVGCMVYQGVVIGPSAIIGHQATLETGVSIGEGASVQPGARVPKGTVVPDGERFPPRGNS